MKKIILILILIHCSLLISNAQWFEQYTGIVNALSDIEFINRNTGWVCGSGVILKTTNGGENWILQTHPAPNKYLVSISPVDSMNVYCVGFFETILKTTNGGTNWIALRNGPFGQGHSYEGTFFVNENTGWICGSASTILKTTNAGLTFDSTFLFWGYLKDLYFKDANTGLLSAEGGGMFKTTNGGLDWEQKTIHHTGGGIGDFRKLSILNNQFVYVVEDVRRVYRSSNFGDTWDSIGYVAGADQPYVCRFSSLTTGWVGGTYGELFKSTNGGVSWRRENTGTFTSYFSSLWFFKDSIGWATRGGGKIMFTETSGMTEIISYSDNSPDNFKLEQNYPNPFNNSTTIEFVLKKDGHYKIEVYNVLGKKVDVIIDEYKKSGSYKINYNSKNLSSGVYLYVLSGSGNLLNINLSKKLILIK